jgi:hypothetical protein
MSLLANDSAPRKRLTTDQRQRLLARYHRSALTQAAFAARHGIGLSTLGKWLREEPAADACPSPVRFQEVVLPGSAPRWAVELVSPQGWIVRLHATSDAGVLPQLLAGLPC